MIYHSISEGMTKAYPNSKADAEPVIDKSGNSSIMTNNEERKMTITDEMNPADWELRQQASDFEAANHMKEWCKMTPQARQDRVEAKAKGARTLAENLIASGVPDFVAWPRARRQEILESDSD